MADRSESPPPAPATAPAPSSHNELALREITQVLLGVASGRFDERASRTYRGDLLDVLAFLANATAEEVEGLLAQRERDQALLQETRSRLAQAEKVAALGELAGGVAHELNQPLTAIETLVELVLQRPDASVAECRSDLELIGRAARRMGKIVRGIRSFADGDGGQRSRSNAVEPMLEAARLLGESLKARGVALTWQYPESLPEILADADRLQQVFINLIHNAADAVADAGSTGSRAILVSVAEQGPWIRYSVEDSGPGVPEAVRHRIFDPFFTTKPVGRGSGLGLSISQGIVQEHGGTLHYEPGRSGGACFVLCLPRLPDGAADESP